jgi:hypothetical protein
MEQHYKFKHSDFNEDGINPKDGTFFLEIVREWELDFHNRFSPLFSNCIAANNSTMHLIKNCLDLGNQEDCGMDSFDGEIDLDKSLEIEKYSKRTTVFAIGSQLDLDEPMWLVIDDAMSDGMVILKYVPDSDDDEVSPEVPVDTEKIKAKK